MLYILQNELHNDVTYAGPLLVSQVGELSRLGESRSNPHPNLILARTLAPALAPSPPNPNPNPAPNPIPNPNPNSIPNPDPNPNPNPYPNPNQASP